MDIRHKIKSILKEETHKEHLKNLKKFIKKKLGVDLTDRISMITSVYKIPNDIRSVSHMSDSDLIGLLNRYGPMFYIKGTKLNFLVQPRPDIEKDRWMVLTNNSDWPQNYEVVLKDIGIELGISLGDIIDMYLPDDEDMLESINESKGMVNVIGNYMSINYPNFTKENAKIVKIKKNIPGVFRPKMSINYYDPVNEFLFAQYWYNDVDKDIQLNCEIFNDLEMAFSGHMDKIVDWFNNEFGEDAESVTC